MSCARLALVLLHCTSFGLSCLKRQEAIGAVYIIVRFVVDITCGSVPEVHTRKESSMSIVAISSARKSMLCAWHRRR